MRRVLPLLPVFAGLAVAASAAEVGGTPAQARPATPPDWLRKPSPEDMSRYYPIPARRRDIGGKVRVQCRLASDGVLSGCVVLSETPPGYGFGEAALNVAPRFQMRPGTREGQPIGGQIIIPISFRPEAPAPAASRRQGAMLFGQLFAWAFLVSAIVF